MPDVLLDYAQRAAEAFIAANRATDRAEAIRLRSKGYKIVALIHQREDAMKQAFFEAKTQASPRLADRK